ncbi:armadillo-type protein [Jimgerdemannia flammicorona]|uniref:Armadillo-type protein n=1 Tax=Jimgerdemannia flammicorona TaxID=994334 RepID=A0A433CYE4_9FUNG|nr:armadillo-type protein [Jimgerdemannia flammicorona]
MNPEPENEEQLYPIAVLIDELKHDDTTLRLNAIRRLGTIACALGPQRTRDELIPFLDESIDDEDEVLLALAEELGNFSEYVGGPEQAHVLLGPLENLAAVEETVVRDKAVESLTKICVLLNEKQLEEFYIPLLKRLSVGDWFTSRTSATGLYAAGYRKLSPGMQDDLRKLFHQLAHDETPMVRRAAAKALAKLSKEVTKEQMVSDVIPLFHKLAQDEQDSVRLLTVECLVAVAELLQPDECKVYLLGTLRAMVSDKSWRIRYMIAQKFVELANAVGEDIIKEDLVTAFVHVLKDNEGEVRTAASGQVPGVYFFFLSFLCLAYVRDGCTTVARDSKLVIGKHTLMLYCSTRDLTVYVCFCKLIDQQVILASIMPCVKDLVTDTSQHVRAALAMQISGLAPILGKEA